MKFYHIVDKALHITPHVWNNSFFPGCVSFNELGGVDGSIRAFFDYWLNKPSHVRCRTRFKYMPSLDCNHLQTTTTSWKCDWCVSCCNRNDSSQIEFSARRTCSLVSLLWKMQSSRIWCDFRISWCSLEFIWISIEIDSLTFSFSWMIVFEVSTIFSSWNCSD